MQKPITENLKSTHLSMWSSHHYPHPHDHHYEPKGYKDMLSVVRSTLLGTPCYPTHETGHNVHQIGTKRDYSSHFAIPPLCHLAVLIPLPCVENSEYFIST